MKIEVPAFGAGEPIPDELCFCNPGGPGEGPVRMAPNRNPLVRWSGVPEGTRSFALIVVDVDAPARKDDANQEGRTIPRDFPRQDFYHWVLVDVPTSVTEIGAGDACDGITARGKMPGRRSYGLEGRNDYTDWFAGDADMEGTYGGYDGPCPPWNDERVHSYHFRIYALDVESLGLAGAFGGADAKRALEGHVLGQAEQVGTYTLNRSLRS